MHELGVSIHLTNHDGKGKDTDKVVDHLEDDFKDSSRVRQSSNSDQGLHCKVVTTNVTADKEKKCILLLLPHIKQNNGYV